MKNDHNIPNLLTAAQAGDPQAENQLFTKLHARFVAVVKSIVCHKYPNMMKLMSEMDFEDAVQEALITVRGKYRQMEFDVGFWYWANKVLENKVRNHVQKIRRRNDKSIPIDDGAGDMESPDSIDAERDVDELLQAITSFIPKMDEVCRKILTIFCEDGGRPDIIKILPEMSIEAIDTRIYRCRKKLKQWLIKNGFLPAGATIKG